MTELKTKQDNLYCEFNTDTQLLDILWILETEDGKFYQKKKSVNWMGRMKDAMDTKKRLDETSRTQDA